MPEFRKKILNNILKLSGSKFFNMFVSIFVSYFKAKILGPNLLGTLRTAMIASDYSHLSTLSLPFVIRRDLPQLIGENKTDEAKNLAAIGFTFNLLGISIYLIGVFIFSFFIHDALLRVAIRLMIPIIFIQTIGGYGNVIAKGLNKYDFLSKINYLSAIINAFIILPLTYFYKLYGVLYGMLIFNTIIAILYYKYANFGFRFAWNNLIVKRLLFAGLPLFLYDISSTIFSSIDRLIIASFETLKDVGFYSLGNMIAYPMFMLISSSSIVIFTHLNEKHGTKNDETIVKKHFEEPVKFISNLIPLIIGMIIIITPIFVKLFLPQFTEGIIAAIILIFAIFYKSTSAFINNALFIMNKQKITAFIFIVSGITNTILSYTSIKLGYGINGVALSTAFSFFLYNFLLTLNIYRILNYNYKFILSKFLKNNIFSLFSIIFIFSLFYIFNISKITILQTIVSLLIFALISLPFYYKEALHIFKLVLNKK